MNPSKSASELRHMIAKAIEDHVITRDEYDRILFLASADGHIDREEQALLEQLNDMIQHKEVKVVKN